MDSSNPLDAFPPEIKAAIMARLGGPSIASALPDGPPQPVGPPVAATSPAVNVAAAPDPTPALQMNELGAPLNAQPTNELGAALPQPTGPEPTPPDPVAQGLAATAANQPAPTPHPVKSFVQSVLSGAGNAALHRAGLLTSDEKAQQAQENAFTQQKLQQQADYQNQALGNA